MPTPLILLVEDEILIREALSEELVDAGFEVVGVGNGEDAIDQLRGDLPFAALFTDIRLPGPADGWDVAEAARELRPGIPVVYATGFSQQPAEMVPGARLLRKPFPARIAVEALHSFGVGSKPN